MFLSHVDEVEVRIIQAQLYLIFVSPSRQRDVTIY